MCDQWEKALGPNINIKKNGYVCELHFKAEDVLKVEFTNLPDGTVHCHKRGRAMLKKDAVPLGPQRRLVKKV